MANSTVLDPRVETQTTDAVSLRIGDAVAVVMLQGFKLSDEDIATALRTVAGWPEIALTRRPSGRPGLRPPFPELGVSIARRSDITAAGFSPTSTVGVDVELADPSLDPVRMADDHFASGEAALVAAKTGAGTLDLFMRFWCAKEAILKATGRGIHDGVAEPNLSDAADLLERDGAIVTWKAGLRVPRGRVAVRRLDHVGAYLSLAVLE